MKILQWFKLIYYSVCDKMLGFHCALLVIPCVFFAHCWFSVNIMVLNNNIVYFGLSIN